MPRLPLLVLVLAAAVAVAAASAAGPFPGAQGSVKMVNGKAQFSSGIDTTADAWGSYDPVSNHPSGFGVLKLESNANSNPSDQYYAAGFLEGVLTNQEIYNMHENLLSTWPVLQNGPPGNMSQFLDQQYQWMNSQIMANPNDPYWQQASLVQSQYTGLIDGYHSVQSSTQKLDNFAFFVLNGCGDLFDLIPRTTEKAARPNFHNMTRKEYFKYERENGHCSALIKLTGNYSELFFGHSSWFRYQSMLRIMKNYNFPGGPSVAKKMSFSSYPGFLESLDDFYMMDSGLAMLQTTNSYYNNSLLQYIVPQSMFAWQRVRIANALASDAKSWHELLGRFNSGTYNNQYMVLNLNYFKPGNPLPDGTLYVGEQVPGTYLYNDYTEVLSRGYFASYNVPAIEEIYNISGYPDMVKKFGPSASYQLAPRATIFRRDQDSVVDLASFQAILRYNDYKNDPYSNGDPCNAICCRGDLEKDGASANGCYDTKVSSYSLYQNLQSVVINGPTTSHGLPPFSWAEFPAATHLGMPTVYNYTFEPMAPNW